MSHTLQRIIVSRTDRIGDVVMSLPSFASLKKCFPRSELIALVREYTSDVAGSFRHIDSVMTYDPGESVFETARKLRDRQADAILFLYPRDKLSVAALLAGIPIRVGTAYRWYSLLFNRRVHEHRKVSTKSEAEYNLSIIRAIGCTAAEMDARLEIDEGAKSAARRFIDRNRLGRFVAIHPGSGGSATDWDGAKFRELCRLITTDPDIHVVITGSKAEKELCSAVAKGIQRCVNSAGEFTLKEFIAFLSFAGVFVSNSTGPIHLAASVGVPVVGLYPNNKPMTPERWAPISDTKIILTPSDGSDDLSVIPAERVHEALSKMITVSSQ